MRYYRYALYVDKEILKEVAKARLKEFHEYFDTPYEAVNNYIYRNKANDRYFFLYGDEGDNKALAGFAYDERNVNYDDAFESISSILKEVFDIKRVLLEPEEISFSQYYELIEEGRRRGYFHWNRAVSSQVENIYHEYRTEFNDRDSNYNFSEIVISDKKPKRIDIYDKSLINEMDNIEKHASETSLNVNPVHYVISGRSRDVTDDIVSILAQKLYAAKRINSRRVQFIKEISPNLYKGRSYLEDILETSYGGVVAIDMSERIGKSPTDYSNTCRYLEKLFKKYRNDCLFVFTYNTDKTGFSYTLLERIKKYTSLVTLREGSGDRRSAVDYMRELIRNSDYSEYASDAAEYMKNFPAEVFTQTDVLEAYEQFESWCINKHVLNAYDFNPSGEIVLDRDERQLSAYDRLQKLIGLETVKEQIDRIIATDIVEKERKRRKGSSYQAGTMHMVFSGNPGTGKTTVAELFAGIAKEKGLIKSGAFVSCGGMDLDGFCCVDKIRDAFNLAKGGVLFVDEAYSLKSDIATTTLIQELENRRDEVIVVLAGYSERMKEFMEQNEGLRSRLPHWVEFPDYSAGELTDVFRLMLDDRGLTATDEAVQEAHYMFEKAIAVDNFGNGRYVRNLIDKALQNQSQRLINAGCDMAAIKKNRLFQITKEDIPKSEEVISEAETKKRTYDSAREELNSLIGLSSVKILINKALANYKMGKLRLERGLEKECVSMHMVFTGNPGTAKTTVARLLAEILKEENVLPTGNFVELGRADLVGAYAGHTAPLVKKRFRQAQGGVLFIDEAYSLCEDRPGGYGDEAINTIVQEMENHRDDVVVIFAGYPKPMEHFLDRNPGMKSRIAFQVEFDDYSVDELCDITKLMLSNRGMSISKDAMNKLKAIYEAARTQADYGNGRFVRKTIEEAEMNLAERLLSCNEKDLSDELLTTIEECDIPEYTRTNVSVKRKIGFAC